MEYHACWKVLEVVVQEQGEWGGFKVAIQQGSLFRIFPQFHKKVMFVQSHTQLKPRPRLQVIKNAVTYFHYILV